MDTSNQNNSGRAGNYWPTIALIVVAAAVGFVVGRGTTNNDAGLASVSESGIEETLGIGEDTKINVVDENGTKMEFKDGVLVQNQSAGNMVVLEKLTLTKEGWVAIHDASDAGPGWILGARKFPAGDYEKFEVNLRRATEPGKKYFAMIHVSNGDDNFEFRAGETDPPLLGADGKPVMTEFQALGN